MTKEEILNILDKNCDAHKKGSFAILCVGIGSIALGIFLFFDSEKRIGAYLVLFPIGVYFIVKGLYDIITAGRVARNTEYAKTVITLFPKELAWAYVKTWVVKEKTHKQGILNFRDGRTLKVYENVVPEENVGFFITSLAAINPQMQIGYSEDMEEKWKKGEL